MGIELETKEAGGLTLVPISYANLNARQKEAFNFQKVAALLANYGFNCIKLADDWQGADFLAYHNNGEQTLKVQLKGRLTIDKKYKDKSIYMAFPINKHWYLIEHDKLIEIVQTKTDWLDSDSWNSKGWYSTGAPSQTLKEALIPFQLSADVDINCEVESTKELKN